MGFVRIGAIISYSLKSIFRSAGKTLILLVLAILCTGAVGFIAMTISQYKELFETVQVKTTATGFSSRTVEIVTESGLGNVVYYQGRINVIVVSDDARPVFSLVVTNDMVRYFEGTGFTNTTFTEIGTDINEIWKYSEELTVIIRKSLVDLLDISLDDTLLLLEAEQVNALHAYYSNETYMEIIKQFGEPYQQTLDGAIKYRSVPVRVTGFFITDREDVNIIMIAPLSRMIHQINGFSDKYGEDGSPIVLEYCEITPTDNYRINEYQKLLKDIESLSIEDGFFGAAHYTDTSELENIERVCELLRFFFPIAILVATTLSSVAVGLIISGAAKPTAILRVLGVTKVKTVLELIFENTTVVVVGSSLAMGLLAIFNSSLFMTSIRSILLYTMLYIVFCFCASVAVSAITVTKKPLSLLQVKD